MGCGPVSLDKFDSRCSYDEAELYNLSICLFGLLILLQLSESTWSDNRSTLQSIFQEQRSGMVGAMSPIGVSNVIDVCGTSPHPLRSPGGGTPPVGGAMESPGWLICVEVRPLEGLHS